MNVISYGRQTSQLLYSIDIRPARNSRLTQRETNHYIARCASVLAWCYLAGRLPAQLVVDLFAQHQRLEYVALTNNLLLLCRSFKNVNVLKMFKKTINSPHTKCKCINHSFTDNMVLNKAFYTVRQARHRHRAFQHLNH